MTFLEWVSIAALTAAIVPVVLFILYYGSRPVWRESGKRAWYRRRPTFVWWSTATGRIWMGQKIAFACLLIPGLFVRIFGDSVARQWFSLTIFAFLVLLFYGAFFDLRDTQRPDENPPQKEDDNEPY